MARSSQIELDIKTLSQKRRGTEPGKDFYSIIFRQISHSPSCSLMPTPSVTSAHCPPGHGDNVVSGVAASLRFPQVASTCSVQDLVQSRVPCCS